MSRAGGRSTMVAAPVRTPPRPGESPVGEPRPLFEVRINSYAPFQGTLFYAVSEDGRFLISSIDGETEPFLNVLVNWEEAVLDER